MEQRRRRVLEMHLYSMKGEQLLLYGPNRAILWQPTTAVATFMNADTPKCVLRIDMRTNTFSHISNYIHATFIIRRFVTYAKSIPSILHSNIATEERKNAAHEDIPRKVMVTIDSLHVTPYNLFRALLAHGNVFRRPTM